MGKEAILEFDVGAGDKLGDRVDWYVPPEKTVRLLSKITKDGKYFVSVYIATNGKSGFALDKRILIEDKEIPNELAFRAFVAAMDKVVREKATKEGIPDCLVEAKVFKPVEFDKLKPGEVYEDDTVKVSCLTLKEGQTPEDMMKEYIQNRDKEVSVLERDGSRN